MILTLILCFIKLTALQIHVHEYGIGKVISGGVYLMLNAYIITFLGMGSFKAGEKVRTARPFVGVVYRLVG